MAGYPIKYQLFWVDRGPRSYHFFFFFRKQAVNTTPTTMDLDPLRLSSTGEESVSYT